MRPLLLHIRRKTRVNVRPDIPHKVHQFRSDWKRIDILGYATTPYLLKRINGHGKIETDAQFAKLLLTKYGPGIYSVIAWCRGGAEDWNMRSFMKVAIGTDSFQRLPRKPNKKQKELMDLMVQQKELKGMEAQDDEEREFNEEMLEYNRQDIEELEKQRGKLKKPYPQGPFPYLTSKQPVYGMHGYDDYEKQQSNEQSLMRL